MLGDLAEWNSFRGLARELGQIRRDLTELAPVDESAGAGPVTQDLHDLSPQQQADVKKLSHTAKLDQARGNSTSSYSTWSKFLQELRQSQPLGLGVLGRRVAPRQAAGALKRFARCRGKGRGQSSRQGARRASRRRTRAG